MGIGYFGMYMGVQSLFQEEKLFYHIFGEKLQDRILLSFKIKSMHAPVLWGCGFCLFIYLFLPKYVTWHCSEDLAKAKTGRQMGQSYTYLQDNI